MLLYHLLGFCWHKNIENWLSSEHQSDWVQEHSGVILFTFTPEKSVEFSYEAWEENKTRWKIENYGIKAHKKLHLKTMIAKKITNDKSSWSRKVNFGKKNYVTLIEDDIWPTWARCLKQFNWSKFVVQAINFVIFNQKQNDSNPVVILPGHAKTI